MSVAFLCDGQHAYTESIPAGEIRAIVHVAWSTGMARDLCREHLQEYIGKIQWEPTLAVTITPVPEETHPDD